VVLHGHASTAVAAAELAAELDPDGWFHHAAPDGPLQLEDGTRAWFSDERGSLAAGRSEVRALLEGLVEDTGLDLVVVGYSQGAAVALAALTDPWRGRLAGLAGLAVLSGFLGDAHGLEQDLSLLAGTPVLIEHGRGDDVVPDFFAADLATSLEDAGAAVRTAWFDMGHERTAASLDAARNWLRGLHLGVSGG
jgi:predicted esterase